MALISIKDEEDQKGWLLDSSKNISVKLLCKPADSSSLLPKEYVAALWKSKSPKKGNVNTRRFFRKKASFNGHPSIYFHLLC